MGRSEKLKYGRGSSSMDEEITRRGSSEKFEKNELPEPEKLSLMELTGRQSKKTNVRGSK